MRPSLLHASVPAQIWAVCLSVACASATLPPKADAPSPPASPPPADDPETAGAIPDETPEPPPLLEPSPTPTEPAAPVDTRTAREIQAVITDNRQLVRDCYETALRENPGIQGDLVVSFVIDPFGTVKEAEVNWNESEIHVPELDECAAQAVMKMQFPPSSRGLESKVNYPFNLNPPKKPPPTTAPTKRHR